MVLQKNKNNLNMFHKTTTCWAGGMIFESDNPSGNKFTMDSKPSDGTKQKGLSPKALMLSSLAGCSGIDIINPKDRKVESHSFFFHFCTCF